MASNEVLSVFYKVYSETDVEITFESRIRNKPVTAVSDKSEYVFTVRNRGSRLCLYFTDDVKLLVSHLVCIRYYFKLSQDFKIFI